MLELYFNDGNFLPESREQIESLRTENPACFVFKNESGGYAFLRRQ